MNNFFLHSSYFKGRIWKQVHLLCALIFLCPFMSFAQLSITATASPAACPNTGSILVTATGGVPNYTYSVTSTAACLPVPLPPTVTAISTYTFNNLPGACTYTVTVKDGNNITVTKTVTINDTYPAMGVPTLAAVIGKTMACSYLKATSNGGSAPFTYTFYSGGSATNPAAIVQAGSSNTLSLAALPAGLYTVKVKDNCGTERVASVTTGVFVNPAVTLNSTWRPECGELRLLLGLQNYTTGVTIDILDRLGNHVSGTTGLTGFHYSYPYVLSNADLVNNYPWGATNAAGATVIMQKGLPVPSDPALYPLTIKVTDNSACPDVFTINYNLPYPAGSTSYGAPGAFLEQCNGTFCTDITIGRTAQGVNNYPYNVQYSTTQNGTYINAGNMASNVIQICGLQPSTTYWVKTTDPCTGRDSAVSFTTPALSPFTVGGGIISYCVNPASPAYLATVQYFFPQGPGLAQIKILSGPGGPRTINGTLASGLAPGTYSLQFTNACNTQTVNVPLTVAGSYSATITSSTSYTRICSGSSITVNASGISSGTLTTPGPVTNFFTSLSQISGGSLPPAGSLHTGIYNVSGLAPGTYQASTAPFVPGISCMTPKKDTIIIPPYQLPVINSVYNLRCAGQNNIQVPIDANTDTAFVYTLYNSSGTIIGGPQSLHGNPSLGVAASADPNIFPNVAGNPGDVFSIRITDRCGNSAITPVSLTNSLLMTGNVKCGIKNGAGFYLTDSLRADNLPGAIYTWTSPSGIVYGPATTSNYNGVPAENGTWHLNVSVTYGSCTTVFQNNFAVSCSIVPVLYKSIQARAKDCAAVIEWTTTEEINSSQFEVELVTVSGTKIRTVAVINAAGFSSTERSYSITVRGLSGTCYFRIKQTDLDHQFTYSNVIPVRISCGQKEEVLSIYPNPVPAGGILHLSLQSLSTDANATMVITDVAGRQYMKQSVAVRSGLNDYSFTLRNLAPGIYLVQVFDSGQHPKGKAQKVVLEP
jgi:hypothetical protein